MLRGELSSPRSGARAAQSPARALVALAGCASVFSRALDGRGTWRSGCRDRHAARRRWRALLRILMELGRPCLDGRRRLALGAAAPPQVAVVCERALCAHSVPAGSARSPPL